MSVELVDACHVGGKEQIRSEWKRIRAVFHDFADLSSKRGDRVVSPTLECHGHKWQIQLYPFGIDESDEQYVSIRLMCASYKAKVKAGFKIRIPQTSHLASARMVTFKDGNTTWGFNKFAKRSEVNNPQCLVDGNLVVEIEIEAMIDKTPKWKPTNTLSLDMLKMLESKDPNDFDVTFQVGKDETVDIFAHRNILKARAPIFSDFIADYPDSCNNIVIQDVEPDTFRMLLRFVYGGEVPPSDILKKDARAIIRAADRFGCTGLKLSAEAEMPAVGITTEHAAELILFADGTNCAMLKEAAMDYFVANAKDVMASDGYKHVAESPAIMGEMMTPMAAGIKKRPAAESTDADGRDFKRMRVATLRQKLDEKGLDVDGSKEMLVSRLEKAENDVIQIE